MTSAQYEKQLGCGKNPRLNETRQVCAVHDFILCFQVRYVEQANNFQHANARAFAATLLDPLVIRTVPRRSFDVRCPFARILFITRRRKS